MVEYFQVKLKSQVELRGQASSHIRQVNSNLALFGFETPQISTWALVQKKGDDPMVGIGPTHCRIHQNINPTRQHEFRYNFCLTENVNPKCLTTEAEPTSTNKILSRVQIPKSIRLNNVLIKRLLRASKRCFQNMSLLG